MLIRSCLQAIYNVARNFGISDGNAEVLAQVVVESSAALIPAMAIAALPPLPSRRMRMQATYAATCWGGMLQAVVHPEVKAWIRDRRTVADRDWRNAVEENN